MAIEQIEVAVIVEIGEHGRMRFFGELLHGSVLELERIEAVIGDAGDQTDLLETLRASAEIPKQQIRPVLHGVEDMGHVYVEKAVAVDISHLDAVPTHIEQARESRLGRRVGKAEGCRRIRLGVGKRGK